MLEMIFIRFRSFDPMCPKNRVHKNKNRARRRYAYLISWCIQQIQ